MPLASPSVCEGLYIGIDLGTSGCRAYAIDSQGTIHAGGRTPMPPPHRDGARIEQNPELWWEAVCQVLDELLPRIPRQDVKAIAVDGTSGTIFLADRTGKPLSPALMYNDARATTEAERLSRTAPRESAAHGPSCGLAKLLWLQRNIPGEHVRHALHQADWVAGRLGGRFGFSDANNCLKTGYDPARGEWPNWFRHAGVYRDWLPQVFAPGSVLTHISQDAAGRFGLSPDTRLVAGTTDSTAAFLATGASRPGEAVTSLGSTLVVKILAEEPVFAPDYGVYSQPLGDLWLVGGGSNSGGAVLRHFFSNEELENLSARIAPEIPSGLDYYPLLAPGERFPVCDPRLSPRLEPRPQDNALFLQGMLEGMARIELQAYQRLAELGAPAPVSVRTVGGGAKNPVWSRMRASMLNAPLVPPLNEEAAYGTALLAMRAMTGVHPC